MASDLARRMVWGAACGLTSKMVRNATRRTMHTGYGTPRLPEPARRRSGFGTALLWAAGTGAALALADVLKEQRRTVATRGPGYR
jgi:hypothetical protein